LEALVNVSNGVIIKPSALDASIGVRYAASSIAAANALSDCLAEVRDLQSIASSVGVTIQPRFLVEEAISRDVSLSSSGEFSIEFLSINKKHFALGITEKYIDRSNYSELGHVFPSFNFPNDLVSPIQTIVTHLLEYLQITNSMSHWEFIVTP